MSVTQLNSDNEGQPFEVDPWEGMGETVQLRAVASNERQPKSSRIVDLTKYLDGTYEPEKPTAGGHREDGLQILYPSRWHTVIGPTETGKSWLGLAHTAAVIETGGIAVYAHFEESTPAGTVARLLQLGLDVDAIQKGFVWLDCARHWKHGEFAQLLEDELPADPALVILDGINAACSYHGWDVEKTSAVSAYRTQFVTPSTSKGAAVLSLGHPVKSTERAKERHGFGSTAWLDEVDGAGFRLLPGTTPITRGKTGYANLYVVKDRYGEVTRHAQVSAKNPEGWRSIASLKVDDTAELTQLWLNKPYNPEEFVNGLSPLAERIITTLHTQVGGRVGSMKGLKDLLDPKPSGGKTEVAVDELEEAGRIRRVTGAYGSKAIELVLGQEPDPEILCSNVQEQLDL